MDFTNSIANSPARIAWQRRPFSQPHPKQVVLTLNEHGEPDIVDPRARGGFYPYMTSGQTVFSSPKGILIDVSA